MEKTRNQGEKRHFLGYVGHVLWPIRYDFLKHTTRNTTDFWIFTFEHLGHSCLALLKSNMSCKIDFYGFPVAMKMKNSSTSSWYNANWRICLYTKSQSEYYATFQTHPSRRSKLHRLWSLQTRPRCEFVTEPSLGQLGKNASVKVGCSFWASHIPYQSLGQTTVKSHTLGARWPSHSVTISNPSQLVGQQAVGGQRAFRCCRFCVKNRYLKQKPLYLENLM